MEEKNDDLRIGRADYEERRQARIDRYWEMAAKHRARETEAGKAAHAAVAGIPLGQPNIHGALTGAIKRSQAATERSIREADAASRAEERAEAAERNTAVSSDDPAALDKLRAKVEKLEKVREEMKAANKLCRGRTGRRLKRSWWSWGWRKRTGRTCWTGG